jgi:hypothetical protein
VFGDRTFFNGNQSGNDSRSALLVQVLRLNTHPAGDGSPIDFPSLVELNSTNGDRMLDFTTAFAFIDLARPSVLWKTPAKPGEAVARNGTVVVKVSGFRVGAGGDGRVRLTIAGGTASAACAGFAEGTQESTPGSGEIKIALPPECSGTGVTLTASLVDGQGLPLVPPAATALVGVNLL